MAELTIGDKTVTVGDEFLKLSPDQQNATVAHIAGQIGAQPAGPSASGDDVSALAAARGLPIVGAYTDKAAAALRSLVNGGTVADNQKQIATDVDAYENAHPLESAVGKTVIGSLPMVPAMAAAPAAFGLTGTLGQMATRGALSGAALSGADAVARGENPIAPAVTGGVIGGLAGPVGRGVGKVAASIADRFRPAAIEAKNFIDVGGVKVPISGPQMSQDAAESATAERMRRGVMGDAAQQQANNFDELQRNSVDQARGNIAAGLDATGASASTTANDAAERVAAELIAQEHARQAAEQAAESARVREAANVQAEGQRLAGGSTPYDAAEQISEGFGKGRDAAKADYREKYGAVGEAEGQFEPGSAAGFRNDVEQGLANADRPVSQLDQTNHANSLRALDVIDRRLNAVGPGRPLDAAEQHLKDVEAVRQKYGDEVAAAYDKQKQATPAPAGPLSLLQFIASKGGLKPHAELDAIGLGNNHRVQIPGKKGFFGVANKSGADIDRMREAAEEAGYLRGENGATSTPRDLLDAMDAELRGQKRFPEGFEGFQNKRETAARSDREQYEHDRHIQGLEEDLTAAGHGGLNAEARARAVDLMSREGMDADTAVEHALNQLEQEDAAGARAFPGDRGASAPVAAAEKAVEAAVKPGSSFTMKDVDSVRKELVTIYGDARRKMMAGGSGSDVNVLEHIMDAFDNRVERMVAEGKFTGGDGPKVLQMLKDARASFADYKAKFARRGSGDTVGSAVEKILGKFSDTKATPDAIVKLAYGNENAPGGEMPVKIAQRIASIFGRESSEFGTLKQGLFAALTKGEPAEAAARIREFLNGTKGKLLSQTVFSPGERISLAKHADRLESVLPKAAPELERGAAADALRSYAGGEGRAPASPNKIVSDLMGATGRGTGTNAPEIAAALKSKLSPEGWTAVRQGVFDKLLRTADGKIDYEAQALSQRLHEFLNGNGKRLAETLYSAPELEKMRNLASVYKQMIPVKGTTNPSGTAPMLAKMASNMRHALLPLLGLTHGGLPGAGVAYLADKGITSIGNANNARRATDLFYGVQNRRPIDPRFARVSGLVSQSSLPAINDRRSR